MKKILIYLLCGGLALAQPWVMFNDMDDTYLYDQASGQVYIRDKKGGKNYEDTFVKMGVINKEPTPKPKAQKETANTAQTNTMQANSTQEKSTQESQAELLKKAQELQRSIQNGVFETTNGTNNVGF